MRTIFGVFADYTDAHDAVQALSDRGFNLEAMNAVVYADVARSAMKVNLRAAAVQSSDELGAHTVHGLDRMLATEQPVPLPPVGQVLAAGELANIFVATATAPGSGDGGFTGALVDLGVPRETAEEYQRGVTGGGVLYWLRVDDNRVGEAREILDTHHARRVGAYP